MIALKPVPTALSLRARLAGLFLAVVAVAGIAPPAAAGPRLDRINESKVLRVGTPGDYRPFAIKSADGYSGHDVDLIEQFAKELGAKIEYVPTTWKTLLPDLQADKFDIAVGGITRNVPRIGVADMLPGYAPFGKVALVRAEHKARFTSPGQHAREERRDPVAHRRRQGRRDDHRNL